MYCPSPPLQLPGGMHPPHPPQDLRPWCERTYIVRACSVRACVRMGERTSERACERACVRACVRASVHASCSFNVSVDMIVVTCGMRPCANSAPCADSSTGGFTCTCSSDFKGPLCDVGMTSIYVLLTLCIILSL